MTEEVSSVGQDALKMNVQKLPEIPNHGAAGVLVLPLEASPENLVSPNLISENQVNHGKSNIKESALATTGVEEILLFDPP